MKHFFNKILPFALLLAWGLSAHAQRTISGKVTDASDGQALIGANIRGVGAAVGTLTDIEGNYRLALPAGVSQIIVSYTGYAAQTLSVNASNTLDVALSNQIFEDVVVIGYGTVRREDLTGSAVSVGQKDFNKGSVTDVAQLIAGKVAGVQVTTGGDPGGGSVIRIRGGSSLNASNDPLIVIDGVPVASDDISGSRNSYNILNPNDIESISVLKDASVTAIYGTRASNGVIMVTTKKGTRASKLRVDYSGSVGISQIANQLNGLDATSYKALVQQQYGAGSVQDKLTGGANTDWQNEIYQTAVAHDHNLAFSGAVGAFPYRLSLGITDKDGLLKTDNFKRTTAAVNLSPSFLDNALQFNLNFKYVTDKNHFADQGAVGAALNFDPTQPIFSGENTYNGYFTWKASTGAPNPLAIKNPLALLYDRNNNGKANRYIVSGSVDYRFWFLKDLRANLNLALDKSTSDGTVFIGKESALTTDGGRDEIYSQEKENKLLEFYLNYAKKFGQTKLDLVGGYSWQRFYRTTDFFSQNVDHTKVLTPSKPRPKELFLLSFFGRANVTLWDKLLLTATLRRDGVSRFTKNPWGWFPAGAAAYKIIQKDRGDVTALKLRVGYGITGQQDIGDNYYPALARYLKGFDNAAYQFGDDYVITTRPEGYNAGLKWEETASLNVGLDWGFWDNRLTGAIEWYQRKSSDLLVYTPVAAGSNLTNFIYSNLGDLENTGIEFSANVEAYRTDKVDWNFGFNLTANTNKITRLQAFSDPSYQGVDVGGIAGGVGNTVEKHTVGYASNSFYVWEQVYDKNGKPIEGLYVDRNNDGVVDDKDKYRLHSPHPDLLLGFNTSLRFDRFDIGLAARASVGNYVYDNNFSDQSSLDRLFQNNGGNYLINTNDRYAQAGFQHPRYWSDFWVRNASFLRIDYLTTGYDLSGIGLAKKLRSMRLYATVQNPLLITEYSGIDPEVYNSFSPGIDNNIYPRSRTYMLGVNVGF